MAFYPYNPRQARLGFLIGAAACAGITAWALWGVTHHEQLGEARAGISAGLMFAFLYAFFRIRPRHDWGVAVEPLRVLVSRPMSGTPIEIVQTQVEMIRRDGKRQDTVVFYLKSGQRIVVARHLFPSPEAFEQLAAALKAWKPEPVLDA